MSNSEVRPGQHSFLREETMLSAAAARLALEIIPKNNYREVESKNAPPSPSNTKNFRGSASLSFVDILGKELSVEYTREGRGVRPDDLKCNVATIITVLGANSQRLVGPSEIVIKHPMDENIKTDLVE